jgi:hypothetical protein
MIFGGSAVFHLSVDIAAKWTSHSCFPSVGLLLLLAGL